MITTILPISRSEYLSEVFKCLSELEKPDDTELLIIVDGNRELELAVDKHLDSISFNSIRIINHTQRPAETINERRYRISDIHNQAKHHVSDRSEYVFLIEDDTTYPPDTLIKMLNTFDANPEVTVYVEGVELGRHNTPYVGAWIANNVESPTMIHSVTPASDVHRRTVLDMDAGGLYCCLVRADLYKQHHFAPFDKEGSNGLSCDVNFGLSLRRQGYYCFIDWSIKCGHLSDKGPVSIDNTKPVQVVFDKSNGKWEARTVGKE